MNWSVNEHDILHKIHENKGIYIRLLVLVLEKQGLKVGLCNQNTLSLENLSKCSLEQIFAFLISFICK
jgi:hypothetical protein